MEEVVVFGRLRSAATDIAVERLEQDVVTDILGIEQIERVGDSNVATALRRVPGLTLVNDEFVYVRGLGERYSSALLNGAAIPSPDLTRNVVPLDIFPTKVIQSLSIQKAYSPEAPAAFGGGSINIRTMALPEELTFSVGVGTGFNSDSTGKDGFDYAGDDGDFLGTDDGARQLPGRLSDAIQLYRGSFDVVNIFNTLNFDGQAHDFSEAVDANRSLIGALNRDVELTNKSLNPDVGAELSIGNRWDITDQLDAGIVGIATYDNVWRNRDRINRSATQPDIDNTTTNRTVNKVAITAAVGAGARYLDDHEVKGLAMFLRNTEDEASIARTFNQDFELASGRGLRNYELRFEERELVVGQLSGTHTFGDQTMDEFGLSSLEFFKGLKFDWFYSHSTAKTDIPNEVGISAQDSVDPNTGALIDTRLRSSQSVASFTFTDLDDELENYGWSLLYPIEMGENRLEISGGYNYSRKAREYFETQFDIGSTQTPIGSLAGTPGSVLSDANINNPDNNFTLELNSGLAESYLAGQIVDAAFGKVDFELCETWRFSGGLRWEQYSQASVPVDPFEFDPAIGVVDLPAGTNIEDTVKLEDDIYPSLSATYNRPGFWGAEDFQLRFGWGETVVRPDIREISEATYIDPLTENRITGNSALATTDITNIDVRAEFFFENKDNFTVSVFYKDIDKPIETVQEAGTDNNTQLTFANGQSAELLGIEIEFLKNLGFLSDYAESIDWADAFFVAGNVSFIDSEVTIDQAGILNLTNSTREMTNVSDYVLNAQLGFDSPDAKHSAMLAYNIFGERLFFAGRSGAADSFEQPFHSVDFIYSYYPNDNFTIKLKLKNLLDESIEIEQAGVVILEQTVGVSGSPDISWEF
ncbi:MAG: TonB-dependent receptor [Pseudomonadota bacterium]